MIYALLFVFLIQIGCASHNLHKMNEEGTEKDPAGPSQEAPVNASSTSSYGNMEEKANKLLKEKDYFKKGVPITDDDINEAIKLLNKNENVLNKTPYYKEFLNKYGSIYGLEFYMCGPIVECYKGCRVQNMVAKNNTFGDVCTDFGISEEQLKYYWLIGHDENIFYYIDSSDIGKGRIYRIDSYSGITKLFAKDFLKFLDRIFNFCKKDSSDES